jgi:copper transport protein
MPARTPHPTPPRPAFGPRVAVFLAVLMAVSVSMIGGGTASAHTGFESSTPSDGAVIDTPVDLITIVFTGEATPVGDKFVALTPDGVVQEPVDVQTLDNKLFSIRFDPPLAGGQIGLRWNVQAADAHPIEGAFSFTVNATAPTTVPPTTLPAVAPSTTVAAAEVVSEEPIASDVETTSPAVAVSDEAATPPGAENPAEVVGGIEVAGGSEVATTQSLDEFLTIDDSTPGETTAAVGRLIGFLGVALGLGALAFVATALRGRRGEVHQVLGAIRIFGVVIAVGAAIEYVGVGRIGGESFASTWSTAPGFATVLRVIGGVGLVVGLAGTLSRGRVQNLMRKPSVVRSLSAAVVEDLSVATTPQGDGSPIVRWKPDARSWPALGGVVLILASFWFDGHTVSKGFRPLHALVNTVHVAAGAVWVGGVVALAAVVWGRYRHHEPMRIVELVVRFSKIATIALASVVAAGGIMAFLVLDSLGELTGTSWGQILLLKTVAVGLAVVGGAYNHFRLLPALEADPESPKLLAELRSTVTAEAIMLVFVVTVTAWLVAAAS